MLISISRQSQLHNYIGYPVKDYNDRLLGELTTVNQTESTLTGCLDNDKKKVVNLKGAQLKDKDKGAAHVYIKLSGLSVESTSAAASKRKLNSVFKFVGFPVINAAHSIIGTLVSVEEGAHGIIYGELDSDKYIPLNDATLVNLSIGKDAAHGITSTYVLLKTM